MHGNNSGRLWEICATWLLYIPKIFKSSKRGSLYFSHLKKKKFHKSIIQIAFFSGTSMEHFMTSNTKTHNRMF